MTLHVLMLLGIAIPAGLLVAGYVILFSKRRSLDSCLQLIGSAGLMLVVVAANDAPRRAGCPTGDEVGHPRHIGGLKYECLSLRAD